MIHTIFTMTLRRYSELDETQNEDLLKRWFNPFPLKWFNTNKFYTQFNETFGQSQDVAADAYLLRSFNTLLALEKLYNIVEVLMNQQNTVTVFSILGKSKPKTIKSNLHFYIDKIKQYTKIDVTQKGGMKKFAKEIERRTDKYKERLKAKEPTEVKSDFNFMDLVHATFSTSGEQYQPSMTIYEFSKLKNRAEKIIKKQNNGTR